MFSFCWACFSLAESFCFSSPPFNPQCKLHLQHKRSLAIPSRLLMSMSITLMSLLQTSWKWKWGHPLADGQFPVQKPHIVNNYLLMLNREKVLDCFMIIFKVEKGLSILKINIQKNVFYLTRGCIESSRIAYNFQENWIYVI